jgi:hypothetical protein
MLKNNFSDYLIASKGCRVESGELTLELWLPWYRSMPLSVVEIAELVIDGRTLALDGAELELNGKRFALARLGELTDEWWFVQDSAWLHLADPGIEPGRPHRAELLLRLYPPYIPMLTWVTRGAATI